MEREKIIATVEAAKQGDPQALNELFNAYYNDVYYFALKTVKDSDLACDITQDTFVQIIKDLPSLQESAAFVSWMKQIAYHKCTGYFRKKKDVILEEAEDGSTLFDIVAEDRTEFIPDEALDQKDFRDTILAMIDTLSEEQRAALLLYYFDELSVSQIARIQNVSEGTVKSRLNYGRKSIKKAVEDYEKKNDVRLHCAGLLPLLLWLLSGAEDAVMPVGAAQMVAAGITEATGTAITVAAGSTAAAVTAAAGGVTTVAGLGAKLAAIPLLVKTGAVALAIAAIIAIGAALLPEEPSQQVIAPIDSTGASNTTVPSKTTRLVETTGPMETTAAAETTALEEASAPAQTSAPVAITTPAVTTAPALTTTPVTTTTPVPSTTPVATTTPAPITTPAPTTPAPTAPEPTTTPEETRELVPANCTYTCSNGTTIEEGQAMPESSSKGDKLVTPDYTYTLERNGWKVIVNDTTKTSYPALLSSINGITLTKMYKTFEGCSNMTVAPQIPSGVTDMSYAFRNCSLLREPPTLPAGLTNMTYTFSSCSSLVTAPIIPSGVTSLRHTFGYCTSLTKPPVIPYGVTDMFYTFSGCTALTERPKIPASVTNTQGTFFGCSSLP